MKVIHTFSANTPVTLMRPDQHVTDTRPTLDRTNITLPRRARNGRSKIGVESVTEVFCCLD